MGIKEMPLEDRLILLEKYQIMILKEMHESLINKDFNKYIDSNMNCLRIERAIYNERCKKDVMRIYCTACRVYIDNCKLRAFHRKYWIEEAEEI